MADTAARPSETDLTVREVANELGTTPRFVYSLVERRELAAIKFGHRFLRIPRAALDAWKADHLTVTPAQRRAALLDDETRAYLRELADRAGDLTEEQRDTIRAAFQGGGRDA